mmetsp:Transcript_26182/g.48830  ORF Transcript_26182/g.48830 Transcript_26182/m.48830 type:complete len:182 (+) Transcript_26182:226-771(+)
MSSLCFYNFQCAPSSGGGGSGGVGGESGTNPDSSGSCFWEGATVDVLHKGEVTMKDLNVGDHILSSNGNYEPVYAFAHQDKTSSAKYIEIHSLGGSSPLKVSEDHLVLVNGHYIPAKDIQVGSLLNDASGSTVTVRKVKTGVDAKGLYAPLTPSGTLLVNGIQASSYISLQKHLPVNLELG